VAPRLFIAAYPPTAIIDQLAALPRPAEPGVRWTIEAQWHVTLRFLGPADVEAAERRLAEIDVASPTARIGPQVAGLGRHAVVAPVGGLDDLADAVRTATADIGQPPDQRPFVGHITLARLKHRSTCGLAGHPLAGSWTVSEVELVASQLHPDGARHTMVARRSLGG
jgi:2'-5' RNA ligase